jgi:AcrR family transcriptional regulator
MGGSEVTPSLSTGSDDSQRILDVVAEILGECGYDSLQLRDVAKRARVSLTTVYACFPSKDELVIAAVERWMQESVYAELPTPRLDTPLSERLTDWYRHLLAPWEQNPTMLRVFMRAVVLPGGERLTRQGTEAVGPSAERMFDGYEQDLADDVNLILTNVVFGLLSQFANGQVDMTDIVTAVERAISRLTSGI